MASTANLFLGEEHAHLYGKFRPSIPKELIEVVLQYLKSKTNSSLELAIDAGCGSGQSTHVFASHFKKVLGYDVSEAQLVYARKMYSAPNIEYNMSKAENLPVQSESADLVTFANCIQWLNIENTFEEVKRILKPNGVVAVYACWYPIPETGEKFKDESICDLIEKYEHDVVSSSYWIRNRKLTHSRYADITLPFKDTQRVNVVVQRPSTLVDFIGYTKSRSSYQEFHKKDANAAEFLLQEFENKLNAIIFNDKPDDSTNITLQEDYFLLMGRK